MLNKINFIFLHVLFVGSSLYCMRPDKQLTATQQQGLPAASASTGRRNDLDIRITRFRATGPRSYDVEVTAYNNGPRFDQFSSHYPSSGSQLNFFGASPTQQLPEFSSIYNSTAAPRQTMFPSGFMDRGPLSDSARESFQRSSMAASLYEGSLTQALDQRSAMGGVVRNAQSLYIISSHFPVGSLPTSTLSSNSSTLSESSRILVDLLSQDMHLSENHREQLKEIMSSWDSSRFDVKNELLKREKQWQAFEDSLVSKSGPELETMNQELHAQEMNYKRNKLVVKDEQDKLWEPQFPGHTAYEQKRTELQLKIYENQMMEEELNHQQLIISRVLRVRKVAERFTDSSPQKLSFIAKKIYKEAIKDSPVSRALKKFNKGCWSAVQKEIIKHTYCQQEFEDIVRDHQALSAEQPHNNVAQQRVVAAQKALTEQGIVFVRVFDISPEVSTVLTKYGIDTELFKIGLGNHYQLQLMQESVDHINTTYTYISGSGKSAAIDNQLLLDFVVTSSLASIRQTEAGQYNSAEALNDYVATITGQYCVKDDTSTQSLLLSQLSRCSVENIDASVHMMRELQPCVQRILHNEPGDQLIFVQAMQNVALSHQFALESALSGDTSKSLSWAGVRDSLTQIYRTLLECSNKSLAERALIGASQGTVEGFVDFAQGVHQLFKDPEKTFHDLGLATCKLVDYLGDLCVLDKETWAASKQSVVNFCKMPAEDICRSTFRFVSGYWFAPRQANKGLDKGIRAGTVILQKTGVVEVLGRAAETGKISDVVQLIDDLTKPSPDCVAITPDGIRVKIPRDLESSLIVAEESTEVCASERIASGSKNWQKERPIVWRTNDGAEVSLKMEARIAETFEKYGFKYLDEFTPGARTIDASSVKGKELIGPKVQTYEQARNVMIEIVGDLGENAQPYVCRMKRSFAYNKVTGRQTGDKQLRWRVDWDPQKGAHINIEDFRAGGGELSKVYVIPFEGTLETATAIVNYLDRT